MRNLTWDAANNLLETRDGTGHTGYPDTQKPRRQIIEHDALYRVTGVDYTYRTAGGWTPSGANTATDPRQEQAFHHLGDPMRRVPAPMLASMPSERPNNITYDYDWLGNQTVWNDDAHAFYERSLGTSDASRRDLLNGTDANESASGHRPAALYFASNVDHMGGANDPAIDRGGYLEVEYGESGNVLSMTVRAQCHDTTTTTCDDPGGTSESSRASSLQTNCVCDAEQHYQYRWDALNRLSFARRYDRGTSHPDWRLEVRQQYRYDGANVRVVKRSRDGFSHGAQMHGQDGMERVALYVMPGDFERRGLQTGALSYDASVTLGTETQYLIAGTRLVWKDASALSGGAVTSFDRDARLTASVPDLLQSSVATVDLMTGELLERGTYLPSGVRETLRTVRDEGAFQLEPVGFTGKEGDDEVGLVYFGHRYLMPHLGRWASPDPLQVHAGGGGEFGNSFHYVGGNLLQARDPNGLEFRKTGEDAETGESQFTGWYEDEAGNSVSLGSCQGGIIECRDRYRALATEAGQIDAGRRTATVIEAVGSGDASEIADAMSSWVAAAASAKLGAYVETTEVDMAYQNALNDGYSELTDIVSMAVSGVAIAALGARLLRRLTTSRVEHQAVRRALQLEAARDARDALARDVGRLNGKRPPIRPATVTAGVNTRTGKLRRAVPGAACAPKTVSFKRSVEMLRTLLWWGPCVRVPSLCLCAL